MYFQGRSLRKYEGGTYPIHCKRQLSCTDRPCKATARLASAPEYSMYCTLAVQRKVPYARRCKIYPLL